MGGWVCVYLLHIACGRMNRCRSCWSFCPGIPHFWSILMRMYQIQSHHRIDPLYKSLRNQPERENRSSMDWLLSFLSHHLQMLWCILLKFKRKKLFVSTNHASFSIEIKYILKKYIYSSFEVWICCYIVRLSLFNNINIHVIFNCNDYSALLSKGLRTYQF